MTDSNLPKLTILDLNNNDVRNILPLVESTRFKSVSQIHLHKNPLGRIDILIHVPALKARGVTVQFDYPVDWNMISTLVGDIDGNNSVNILDLVIVAMQFGKTGSNLLGDVNGDSFVNILDLVQISYYILELSSPAFECAADYSGNGEVNILDLVQIVNFVLNE